MLPSEVRDGPAVDHTEHLTIRIDHAQHRAFHAGHELHLTGTEFRLLECLLAEPGRIFSRAELAASAIGGGAVVLERTIDVHICSLRRKLRQVGLIETVRRMGYRFQRGEGARQAPA